MVSKRAFQQIGADATSFFGAFAPLNASVSPSKNFFDFGIGNIQGMEELSNLLKEKQQELMSDALLFARHYPGTQGLFELNSKIAEFVKKEKKISVLPEQIVLTNGAVDAISNAVFLHLEQGESCFFGVPSFPYWFSLERERVTSEVEFFSGPKEYKEQFGSRFLKAVQSNKKIRAVVFDCPHNPLGVVISAGQMRLIDDTCSEFNAKVIVDDVYSSMTLNKSCNAVMLGEENRIIIDSFSKKLALPGLRLGFAIVPEQEIKYFRAIVANKSIGVSNLVTSIANNLFDFYEQNNLVEMISKEIKNRHKELQKFIPALEKFGINSPQPDGGLYRIFMLKEFTEQTGIDAKKLCEILLKEGVKVLPAQKFYPSHTPANKHANFFRISVGGDPRIKEGMEKIVKTLEKIQ